MVWTRIGFDADTGKNPANLVQCVSERFSILGQCGSASGSRSGFGSRYIYFTFLFILTDNCNIQYVALGLHEGRPSNRRILQPSKGNIQHLTYLFPFLFLRIFCPPGSGSGCHSKGRIQICGPLICQSKFHKLDPPSTRNRIRMLLCTFGPHFGPPGTGSGFLQPGYRSNTDVKHG